MMVGLEHYLGSTRRVAEAVCRRVEKSSASHDLFVLVPWPELGKGEIAVFAQDVWVGNAKPRDALKMRKVVQAATDGDGAAVGVGRWMPTGNGFMLKDPNDLVADRQL